VNRLKTTFGAAGIPSPQLDARLIVQHATGLSHEQLIAAGERRPTEIELRLIEELAVRRLAREPVSRLLGEREFYGRRFWISAATLDPRPETEILVDAALHMARGCRTGAEGLRVADLGTGSGAIIVTLLAELPLAGGAASDISADALEVAQKNALRHKVADRLELLQGSWFDRLTGTYDLIVSNPPYVAEKELGALPPEVRLYDPREALDGGKDGLSAYRRIARDARRHLRIGGHLVLEIGRGQEGQVTKIVRDHGLRPSCKIPAFTPDLSGIVRVLAFETD
jgi:release factor glutamine methyltransferase